MKAILSLLLLLLAAAGVHAFPPAPYYTLYGLVRDQVGQTITAEGAVIVLLKDGLEVGRTPITSNFQLDQNYELQIHIDQNRSGTTFYSAKAVAAQGLFSLVVEMNGSLFYPIEVAGKTYTIERSLDFATWTREPVSIGAPAAGAVAYTATNVGILPAFTTPLPGSVKECYRLTVR